MAQLFVSHSSADNDLAAKVKECLADLGYESVFLDFDPTGGLVPGQAWRDQLFNNLDSCDAVVFLTTPRSNASQWCHSELALARWLRKPILALLFDGVEPHPLTADLQGLHASSAQLDNARVRAALAALGLDQAAPWDASRSPYPGLRAFDESYAAVFFGRDRQIDQLRQLVDPPSRTSAGAIVPVLGPSGSGKSSLVRAGLVPALRVGQDWVLTEPWTPSDVPLAEMSLALAHAAKRHDADLDADRCAELLNTPGGMGEYVRTLRAAGSLTADTKVLVVVDQAEELVTITPDAERRAFLEALTTSCREPSPLRVVMTARTDMWDRVAAATAQFEMAVAPTVLHVPPLSRLDLAVVIREPARRSHLTLDDGLLDRLVDDTGSGDALPLLAFTLARMAADAKDGRLTRQAYEAIGGVRGAIASRAAEVAHGGRSETEVAEAILHLVSLTDATPHKRLARASDIPPAQRQILDELVEARLVVVTEVNDAQVYAPAHEALLSAWPPLAALIESRREDLLLRGRMERRAADWREAGATSSGLLSGLELDQARDWLARSGDLATPDVSAYVAASVARERRSRTVRATVSTLVAALAVALVVALLVNSRSNHRLADASRRLAVSARVGELAAIAQVQLDKDPVAAAIALIEGFRSDPSSARLTSVATTLLASPGRDVIDTGDPSIAAAGQVAITGGAQGRPDSVWDLRTGRKIGEFPLGASTAVRPDGRMAVSSTGQALDVYDFGDQQVAKVASFGHGGRLLSFSPDGALLAEVDSDAVVLWDVRDPTAARALATWRRDGSDVQAVSVLDDGTVLVATRTAALVSWAALDSGEVRELVAAPPALAVSGVLTDAAGTKALLSGPAIPDGDPLLDLRTGRQLRDFKASGSSAGLASTLSTTWASTIDPTGTLVAAFDLSGRGYVFSADDGHAVAELSGSQRALINRGAFLGDGTLATANLDGVMQIWDPAAPAAPVPTSLTKALCHAFGDRMDEDSWAVAMGKRAFDSPCPPPPSGAAATTPLTLTADVPAPLATPATPTVVLHDDFEGPPVFRVGRYALRQGHIQQTERGGTYRMVTSGLPDDFTTWAPAPADLGPTWSLTVTPARSPGASCGVMAGSDDAQLTAVLDRDTGEGQLTWFADDHRAFGLPFTAPTGDERPLSLRGDHGQLAVLLGDDRLITAHDDSLPAPTQVGLVAVGNTSCSFEGLTADRG